MLHSKLRNMHKALLRWMCFYLMLLLVACSTTPTPEVYQQELRQLLDTIQRQRMQASAVDTNLLRDGIALAESFKADYPDDTIVGPQFTYHQIKWHTELGHYGTSLALIDSFRAHYPSHDLSPKLLHFKGFYIYEQGLRDLQKARATYEQFLREYPKHDALTEAVLFSLENLGRSDEEVLDHLLKKAKERQGQEQP